MTRATADRLHREREVPRLARYYGTAVPAKIAPPTPLADVVWCEAGCCPRSECKMCQILDREDDHDD